MEKSLFEQMGGAYKIKGVYFLLNTASSFNVYSSNHNKLIFKSWYADGVIIKFSKQNSAL